MWLRMGPNDISNVIAFLERQLEFIENADFFPEYFTRFDTRDDIDVYYANENNETWFETNKCLSFYLSGRVDDRFYDGSLPYDFLYKLPSIHYGLAREDGELTCYIYGIQNLPNNNETVFSKFTEETQTKIKGMRKPFRNSYVSPYFVIALKYFLELLEQKGITTIKVPFLQVFNYDYHVELSDESKMVYDSYSDEDRKYFDKQIANGVYDDLVGEYEDAKIFYNRFADKQDMISRNKVDRFLRIFMVLAEKVGNIEVITEPAINGDFYIIVKIKPRDLDKNTIYWGNGHGRC